MYCRELGIYINQHTTKYVLLDNGKEVKRADISDEEYEALKEWGCIIREFERQESEVEQMKKYWYLKIKLKDRYDGRKIWYMNDGYICDCVNLPFQNKEECNASIPMIKRKFGSRIESITLHWTR